MKIKKLIFILALGLAGVLRADEASRARLLIEDGLRYFSERQYSRALDLFKQAQRIDPNNRSAQDYISVTEEKIAELDNRSSASRETRDRARVSSRNEAGDVLSNAADIVAARKSLVDRMKNRSTNIDQMVRMDKSRDGLLVTLYHDQMFLPGLTILREESLPILERVAQAIRERKEGSITLSSTAHSDSNDPYLLYQDGDAADARLGRDQAFLFQDVETARALTLFTHLAQRTMVPEPKN